MATVRKRTSRRAPRRITTSQILLVVLAAIVATGIMILLDSDILRQNGAVAGKLPYEVGITADGAPYKGSPDAPLKVVLYSDFLCSHCADLADSLEALAPDYITPGKVQVIFHNYAFLTPESVQAAMAAECALNQGADKFWKYHNLLYGSQRNGLSAYTDSALKDYAREIGLDEETFNTCLDSGATRAAVQADTDRGVSEGVEATPTWFLNGEMIPGAVPLPTLRSIFDQALAQQ